MILSLQHGFLFIHVYKVAGTSIVGALGDTDIRRAVRGMPPSHHAAFLKSCGVDPVIMTMHDHAFAKKLRGILEEGLFNALFKFGFVRNPWDIQLSLYHYNLAHPEARPANAQRDYSSFERFILSAPGTGNPLGQQKKFLYDDDGTQLVDFIGRFENLKEDFSEVCRRIGLEPPALERRNATDHEAWPSSYSREMFEHVRKRQIVDIETFGYPDDPDAYGVG